MTQVDPRRRSAYEAVYNWLDTHSSNTISNGQIWNAVNVALDKYEDEMTRDYEAGPGYAIMLDGHPMLVVDTRRQARQQRRIMRRMLGRGHWQIRPTQVARPI